VFVLTLIGFHIYILSLNLTTQEKLNHKYDKFPISPFSYGGVLSNWYRVICCPKKRSETRLSYPLFLKTNYPEQFEQYKINEKLPDAMCEKSVELQIDIIDDYS